MSKIVTLEQARSTSRLDASAHAVAGLIERGTIPRFRYTLRYWEPRDIKAAGELRSEISRLESCAHLFGDSLLFVMRRVLGLKRELQELVGDVVWERAVNNLVVNAGLTAGATDIFLASAYTAAWYAGLINGTGSPAVAATDTMASHPGWTEFTSYSEATRPSIPWGTVTNGVLPATAITYDITAAGSVYGAFVTDNDTISGTTGTLYSAGAFSGGTESVSNGGTLDVTIQQALAA